MGVWYIEHTQYKCNQLLIIIGWGNIAVTSPARKSSKFIAQMSHSGPCVWAIYIRFRPCYEFIKIDDKKNIFLGGGGGWAHPSPLGTGLYEVMVTSHSDKWLLLTMVEIYLLTELAPFKIALSDYNAKCSPTAAVVLHEGALTRPLAGQ